MSEIDQVTNLQEILDVYDKSSATSGLSEMDLIRNKGLIVAGVSGALQIMQNAFHKGPEEFTSALDKLHEDVMQYPAEIAKQILRAAMQNAGNKDGTTH